MHKTWRASDVVMLLALGVIALMSYLQMNQAERNYARLDKRLAALADSGAVQGPPSGSGHGAKPPVDRDKLGDWLVRHFGAEPRTLNPITSKDAYASIVQSYLYDSLVDRDPDTLQWRPQMAQSWEISEDKMTLTFRLRDGMLWSDGQPITADDVVFSFQTMMDPQVDAVAARGYYQDVESVKAADRLTVEFRYRRPYFLSFEVCGGTTVIPRHVYKYEDGKKFNEVRDVLVGSGPYVFEEWKPAQSITVRRNPRYYGPPAHFDKIVFKIVQDDTAALQMCKAQEIDRLAMTAEQYRKVADDQKFNANYKRLRYPAPGNGYNYIGWNNRSELFKDRRVRLALTHLVPRERLKKEIFHDLVAVATGPFWPGSENINVALQADTTIEPWPFDQTKAVQLLGDAGWRDTNGDGILDREGRPFRFQLIVPQGSQAALDIAGVTKEEMGRVGIAMEVIQLEWSVFTGKLDTREYEAVLLGWTGGIEGDPYQIWHSDSIKDMGSNHMGFSNAEADRLIVAARVEFDREKRNELYHRFHRLLHEEQPYTFLFNRDSLAAVHKRFEGVVIHPLGLEDKDWWTPAGRRVYTQ